MKYTCIYLIYVRDKIERGERRHQHQQNKKAEKEEEKREEIKSHTIQ